MNVNNIIKKAEETNNKPARERPPLEWADVHVIQGQFGKITISKTLGHPRPLYSYKVGGVQGMFLKPRIAGGSFNTPPMVENDNSLAEEMRDLLLEAAAWVNQDLAESAKLRMATAVVRDESRAAVPGGTRHTGKTARDRAKKGRKEG